MTEESFEQPRPYLTGDEAVSWFMHRRGGGHLFDEHMSLIYSIFGDDIPLRFRAAVDPQSGEPSVLIIDVMRPPDDEGAWRRLVETQERLLEREERLRENLHLKEPFRKIVLSLGGQQSNWADLASGFGDEG